MVGSTIDLPSIHSFCITAAIAVYDNFGPRCYVYSNPISFFVR